MERLNQREMLIDNYKSSSFFINVRKFERIMEEEY